MLQHAMRQPDYAAAVLNGWVKQVRDQDWQDGFVFFRRADYSTQQL